MDLAPLMYPGATCVRGAYKIYPFYESELMLKVRTFFYSFYVSPIKLREKRSFITVLMNQ